ncbi:MAG: carboxyltransferase domain-containing protein [Pseudomonadota bacterium]
MKPTIKPAGFDGFLVTFGEGLDEAANRAALAFRNAVEAAGLAGVQESATSLVSTYLRFDPLQIAHDEIRVALETLLGEQDWHAAPLPQGRRLWRIPAAFGDDAGPQLAEAAEAAGMGAAAAVKMICATRLRVQTIGFAPGMPYLGVLPEAWDIPRLTDITAAVPAGGLCLAIRQMVLFPNTTPTGWRHVGQTAVRLFQPEADAPFLLRSGDEIAFHPVGADALAALEHDPGGGAICEALA